MLKLRFITRHLPVSDTPLTYSEIMADSITELRDYKGNCHCGAVKFSVSIPDLKEVECCDCSLCAKKSIMWKLMPPENFTFIKGENYLTDYAFGKKRLTHKVSNKSLVDIGLNTTNKIVQFCPTCGIQIVSIVRRESGVIEYAANVRRCALYLIGDD